MQKTYYPIYLDQTRFITSNPAQLIQSCIEKGWLTAPKEKDLFIVEEDLVTQLGNEYKNRFDYYLETGYLKTILTDLKILIDKIQNPQILPVLTNLRETIILYLNGCTSRKIDDSWNDFLNRPHVRSYFTTEFKY